MGNQDDLALKAIWGVMVSSTFTDLKEHRDALIRSMHMADLTALGMENDSAKPGVDVLV